jgi:hypothetical protein
MRRAPPVCLLTLALGLGAAVAAAAGPAKQAPPKLAAALAACETGPERDQRFAVFTGSMPAMAGTRRMAMRFDLQERRSDTARFRRVAAPKFGRWNRSRPGVGGFVFTKRVTRLEQGRWYRAVVRFRWIDARGRVQRTARRVTPVCHQPDQRPNLRLASFSAARPGSYLVTVENAGQTPAGESTVALEPRPGVEAERIVPPLAPGERATVVVEAEKCDRGSVVVVQLDRHRAVDESREDDNRVEQDCPGSPGSASGGR